jgi:outer membrane protein insertion porin family
LQSDTVFVRDIYINKIIIAGNDVTDEDIILRELSTKENSRLDPKRLKTDVEQIYKLGLFNKVEIFTIPTETLNKVDLMFLVEERFYIIPLPQGGFRDGEFSKFWAGANVLWSNFRGRNETASLSFGIGYEPFVSVGYSVPWIGKDQRYFASTSIGYSKNYNQSLIALNDSTSNTIPSSSDNFAIFNFNAALNFGKYFTDDFAASASLRYNVMETSPYEPGRTVSPDGKDNFLTFVANGKFDTRNSREYTLAGSYYNLEYKKYGFGKLFDFNRVNYDVRKFIPIKLSDHYAVTFASRSIGAISFGGTIPYYLEEYYGYNKIIRGYKNVVSEGENQFGLFNEFRIPVIDPFYTEGKSIPVVENISALKNLSYKFGLYATAFFDIGTVWNKNSNFFDSKFINGFGAGLNFILPFGFVGRTDFAFRKEQKKFIPQIIFDLDAAF